MMRIYIERFVLAVLAALAFAFAVTNPTGLSLPARIIGLIIIVVVAGLFAYFTGWEESRWERWKRNYVAVGRWLLARSWVVISTLIAIAGLIVFVIVETQLTQLKKDVSTISPEANGPAAKLSQVSDLAEALAKVPWIEAEIKKFDDAAKRYDESYREHSPPQS
jgi:hypothetical protein